MPNKILIKRSDLAARRPTLTDLDDGELFLNTADEQISMKNKAGTYVKDIIPKPSFNGAYLLGHDLAGSGFTSSAYSPNPNTGMANYAPIYHRHEDVVGKTYVTSVTGWNNTTLYSGQICSTEVRYSSKALLKNISIVIKSYWTNSGPVTLSIGLHNFSSGAIVDEEAFLKKISLKSDSPLAYGEVISLQNPKGYAGPSISNGSFLNAYSHVNPNYLVPYFFVRVPNGGNTSGSINIFSEYAANISSLGYQASSVL
jgi:hypothetical protein